MVKLCEFIIKLNQLPFAPSKSFSKITKRVKRKIIFRKHLNTLYYTECLALIFRLDNNQMG